MGKSIFESFILRNFHRLWYSKEIYKKLRFFGIPILKNPFDLWIYQELIYDLRPDFIVEVGSFMGGAALYFTHILTSISKEGKVISIDIKPNWDKRVKEHPNILTILGDSTSKDVYSKVYELCDGKNSIVILDSDHRKEHVLKELFIYERVVPKGFYIIVEDGNIGGHPVRKDFGPGPYEAVEEFLKERKDFVVDKNLEEKFLFTFCVNGFLKRVYK